MKRALALLLLVGLVAAGDVVAAAAAEREVARQLQTAAALPARPQVDVRGWPFLPQAVRGRYADIRVQAADVPTGGVPLARLDVRLTGVRAPLAAALRGAVRELPVERLDASALVSYDALSRASDVGSVALSAAGDLLRVSGRVSVLGVTLEASALSSVSVRGDVLVVTAQRYEVGGAATSAVVTAALRGRLDLRLRVGTLPYGLVLSGARVVPGGVALRASAEDAVLRPGIVPAAGAFPTA